MSKSAIKSIYVCSNCGESTPKWLGRCPACNQWNTFVEDAVSHKTFKAIEANAKETVSLSARESKNDKVMFTTGIGEFDRVLGGGIMPDSFTLLSGDPGIGKSTLCLQVAGSIAAHKKQVLYVSGEESVSQISMRARRLNIGSYELSFLSETNLDIIMATLEKNKPDFVVVDSAQVLSSPGSNGVSGSISQTKMVAENLMRFAKSYQIPVMLIGHVNKMGDLAGPKALEHLVDTVLYLEGEKYQAFRLLRSMKNRFGATDEIGVFEMDKEGMVEVKNPSQAFLEGRKKDAIGSVITSTIEGTRPFLVEVQALTTRATFNYPKRTASGADLNRLQLLIAVLTKHAKLQLDDQDVYINVTGGFRISEPATDLAIAVAIASSKLERSTNPETIIFGEIGLAGELRPVTQIEKRLKEAERLGFKQALIPKMRTKPDTKLKLIEISDIAEIMKFI